jgi:hypothetical protein
MRLGLVESSPRPDRVFWKGNSYAKRQGIFRGGAGSRELLAGTRDAGLMLISRWVNAVLHR